MELTDTQKEAVAAWFADGASLDEIQKRIKAEFGIHMTYLDVRLMVAELPQPAEAGEREARAGAGEAREGEAGAGEGETAGTSGTSETSGKKPQDYAREFSEGPDSRQGYDCGPDGRQGYDCGPDSRQGNDAGGSLAEGDGSPEGQAVPAPTVTIDTLMIPGTIASGEVTFTDGQTGKWFIDQMGRLGLGGDLPQGYRPSPTDAALFQQQLMQLLQSRGLY